MSRRRSRRGWRQLALFAAAYAVYCLARWLFVGNFAVAKEHADWILGVEENAGVAIEFSVQGALSSPVVSWILSNIYMAAQIVVVPAALVWLYRHSPEIYRPLRNTLLAGWLIAVLIYAVFPVAPPRLAEPGIVDNVSGQAGFALTGWSTLFYNPLAAVPSLHVGFAVAIGVAAAFALRRPWAKALALLWGPIVALAVVATGNHYVFDIGAGLAVMLVGYAVGQLFGRFRLPGVRRGTGSVRSPVATLHPKWKPACFRSRKRGAICLTQTLTVARSGSVSTCGSRSRLTQTRTVARSGSVSTCGSRNRRRVEHGRNRLSR